MIRFDCMTPDEFALWQEAARHYLASARVPCVDCPMAYHLAEKAAGRCDREPQKGRGPGGRPRVSLPVDLHGRGNPYATEEERTAARRQSWRDSKVRMRLAQASGEWDNHESDGTGGRRPQPPLPDRRSQ